MASLSPLFLDLRPNPSQTEPVIPIFLIFNPQDSKHADQPRTCWKTQENSKAQPKKRKMWNVRTATARKSRKSGRAALSLAALGDVFFFSLYFFFFLFFSFFFLSFFFVCFFFSLSLSLFWPVAGWGVEGWGRGAHSGSDCCRYVPRSAPPVPQSPPPPRSPSLLSCHGRLFSLLPLLSPLYYWA